LQEDGPYPGQLHSVGGRRTRLLWAVSQRSA
jgi:hypothetical protein